MNLTSHTAIYLLIAHKDGEIKTVQLETSPDWIARFQRDAKEAGWEVWSKPLTEIVRECGLFPELVGMLGSCHSMIFEDEGAAARHRRRAIEALLSRASTEAPVTLPE